MTTNIQTLKEYELGGMSKERVIEFIENDDNQQVLKHKGKFFLIMYYDRDYSSSETHCGEEYDVGEKVYCKGAGKERTFIGTVIDMKELTWSQLCELVMEGEIDASKECEWTPIIRE